MTFIEADQENGTKVTFQTDKIICFYPSYEQENCTIIRFADSSLMLKHPYKEVRESLEHAGVL